VRRGKRTSGFSAITSWPGEWDWAKECD